MLNKAFVCSHHYTENGPRLTARYPDIFTSIGERESIRKRGFILKPFGRFLLALKNSDLLKVEVSECNKL